MAIKGLTHRGEAFPVIGQIRKGKKEQLGNGKSKPVDLQYFRVVFDEEEAKAEELFKARYGEKPSEIDILLPFGEVDKQWVTYLGAFTASRLVARSDGERLEYLANPDTGDILIKDGDPEQLITQGQADGDEPIAEYTNQKGDKTPVYLRPVGKLRVMVIPLLKAGRLACLEVITGSKNDIANLDSQLRALYAVNQGSVAGIPLKLRRRKKEIGKKLPNGQRIRGPSWLLSIEAADTWTQAKIEQLAAEAMPQLPAGSHATIWEGDEIVDGEAKELEPRPEPKPEKEAPKEEAKGQRKPREKAKAKPKPKPEATPAPAGPREANDYRGYYEGATQHLSKADAREILEAHENDALKAWEQIERQAPPA